MYKRQYITNTTLSKEEVIEKYGQLWQIEKAFRISKSDLQIRPIYHHLRKRIEAHICISSVSYTHLDVYKRQSNFRFNMSNSNLIASLV